MINYAKFPHKEIRPLQKKVLDAIDQGWDDYDYIIMELPVGVGKSAIAMNICNSVDNGFIITSTKQLQDQYINDFKGLSIKSIKGKANYKCSLNKGLNCESGYCVVEQDQLKECKKKRLCPYFNAREAALNANAMLTSYQYFLRAVDCAKFLKPRNVIIFDECHLLENQIVQWAEMKLSPRELVQKYNLTKNCNMQNFVEISVPPEQSGFKENEHWLSTLIALIFNRRNEKFNEIKLILGIGSSNPDDLTSEQLDTIMGTHKEYYELDKLYKKLDVFFKGKDHNDWIIDPWEDGLQLIPIAVATLFNKYIKSMCIDKIIFMSATILDLNGFRDLLGLSKDKTMLIKADSDFDPEKSPIIYKPICKMNYEEINNNLDKIAIAVEEILNKHPDEKGIIHTGNSVISKYLQENIKSNRLLVRYGDVVNEDIVKRHYKSSEPTVLVSSSLSEGIDLKDELSRFQIIVKLPWKSLADKRIKEKVKRSNDWYVVEMFKSLIQQCGRSTRSGKDYSITYILDNSFKWWITKHQRKGWFYPQFLKRMIWKEK